MSARITRDSPPSFTNFDSTSLYLTFILGREEFGIQINRVREIIEYTPITAIPQMPEYVKGVINLRGQVIPVINLRLRFDMEENEITDQTCIIVIEAMQDKRQMSVGFVVDCVQEVIDINGQDIDPSPRFDDSSDTHFILGIAKVGSSVKILLDIDRVLCGVCLNESPAEDATILSGK